MTGEPSTALDYSQHAGTSLRTRVQKFGTFLSNMIMPNIAAIIAWGLVTAFFIPVGWTPEREDRHDGRPVDLLPAARS